MASLFSDKFGQLAAQILHPSKAITRPTIILVHGGWQSPESFSKIVPRLEKAGYSVFAPILPSSGTIPALPDFSEDVKAVRHAVESMIQAGKDVVVVMHSYGAIPGCEALRDLKVKEMDSKDAAGGIVKLVFLSGMLVPVGGSTWSAKKGNEAIPGFSFAHGLITIEDSSFRFYNDLPCPEAAHWARKLKRQSRGSYASKLTYPAYKIIPSSYLFCTNDRAIPLQVQERYAKLAGITETKRIDSGHSPHISQPSAVVRFIRKSAGEINPLL